MKSVWAYTGQPQGRDWDWDWDWGWDWGWDWDWDKGINASGLLRSVHFQSMASASARFLRPFD
jgi:hypothetical protein